MVHYFRINILILLFLTSLISCIEKPNNSKEKNIRKNNEPQLKGPDSFLLENDLKKEVFYGLYSPVEISNMIKEQEILYSPEWFLPTSKSNDFQKSPEIALNLGVYGADFSFAKMFNSTSDALEYLEVISDMSDKLGIPSQLVMESADRLDKNMHNMDSLTQIAFETFEKSTEYLYDNDRESTANLVILGGWIEALYQITNNIGTNTDPKIVELVIEQKYSLNFLMSILKNYYDDPYVAYYYRMLQVLQKYFDKLDFEYKEGLVKVNKEKQIIETEWTRLNYTTEEIEKVKNIVATIRGIVTNS